MGETSTAVNLGGAQWVVYKDLLKIVSGAIYNRDVYTFQDLEVALRTHKRDFLALLKNPAKKAESREAVKKATTDGIRVLGYYGTKILTQAQVDDALTIADLFDLNEISALELLLLAESQQSRLSAKTRGLAAVVLYYDGRQSLVSALRILIQARSGRSWTLGTSSEVTDLITRFTNDLWNEGLSEKLFWQLESFNIEKELEKLEEKRALGDPKHRKQVLDLIEDVHTTLAECLYCWTCQSGLDQTHTLRLINILSNIIPSRADGNLDEIQFALLMACLYALDLTTLAAVEDSDDSLLKFPLIANEEFVLNVHKELLSQKQWTCPGLKSVLQFAWAVSLRVLSQLPIIQGSRRQQCTDDDEAVIEIALEGNALNSLRTLIVGSSYLRTEEFFFRRIHGIITDFIVNMPLKIKELRNRGDEVARIVAHSDPNLNQSLLPPIYFSMFMNLVADLYSKDVLGLELNADYWCPTESPFQLHRSSLLVANPSQKQIKELRNRGDEVARIVAHSDPNLNQSLLPPIYFSMFMNLVADLYSKDVLGLELNADYWCPTESPFQLHRSSLLVANPSQKQVNLYKFILLAGEFLPPSLYIPYIKMLKSLSSSPTAANHCFHLLKSTGSTTGAQYGIVSWDHFFGSFQRYAANLAQESSTEGISQPRNPTGGISPQEIEGLQVVLELIETVALNDEVARATFCENVDWNPLSTFLALVCCSIPIGLKGQIVSTLASLIRNSYVAVSLWQNLENSNILPTRTDGNKSSIQMELEEMESHCEVYPLTCAVLNLLSILVDTFHSLDASGQEVNARFDSCVTFIINHVISKFHLRSYKSQQEKWQVASLSLEFLTKLVAKYQPELDFSSSHRASEIRSYPSSGQLIMINMLQNSLLLKTILNIIDEVTHVYDQFVPSFPGKTEMETCSLLCLKLILKVLELQETFVAYVREKKLSVLIVGLDHLLMGINPRSNLADYLILISKFINHNVNLPEHAFYAVEIIAYMCHTPSLHPSIVGAFAANPDEVEQFRQGIIECLEAEDDEVELNETSSSLVADASRVRCSIRESILRLLIHTVNYAKPNIALYLLGFEFKKNLSQVTLQDAGVIGSPYTCLHTALEILSQTNASKSYPVTAELCQQLIYTMCCHEEISAPTMRYLRSSHDFFERQLKKIPFKMSKSDPTLVITSILNRQAWLLKTIAIELRVAAVSGQCSNLHRLLSLLVDNRSPSEMVEGNRSRPKLLGVLDDLEMSQTNIPTPQWEFFDSAAVEKVILYCQRPTSLGLKAVDVRSLHKLLVTEVEGFQGSLTLGQQPLVNKEIQSILEYVTQNNQSQLHLYSKRMTLEAWRHLTETVIATMSDDFLDFNKRVTIILELIHHFLHKISDDSCISELVNPSTTVLTTLFSSLRQNFLHSSSSWKSYSSSLEVALRGLINCMLKSSNGPYKVRANYYSGLLSLLRIGFNSEDDGEKFLHMNLDIINSYEQDLFELLCHDMCSVNDLAKMLALSCLSALVSGGRNESLLKFLAGHGYLKECINSLLHDDTSLSSLPIYQTDNLRKLYVYETKMTFFIHLASIKQGAKLLVLSKLLEVLSQMQSFDNQLVNPISEMVTFNENESNPWNNAAIAFHQILVPALKVCLLLLSSSSGLLFDIRLQITQFLVSHIETFSFILRRTKSTEKELLEQALVCAVITKVLIDDGSFENDPTQMEAITQLSRLQRLSQNLFAALITNKLSLIEDSRNLRLDEINGENINENITWDTTVVAILSFFSSRINSSDASRLPQITFSPILKIGTQLNSFPEYTTSHAKKTHQLQDLGLLVFLIKYATLKYLSLTDKLLRATTSQSQPLSIWHPQTEVTQDKAVPNPIEQQRLKLLMIMLEKTMYLLWFHLDFYLNQSAVSIKVKQNETSSEFSSIRRLQDTSRVEQPKPSPSKPWNLDPMDKQDLRNFKNDCAITFTDSLLGRVTEVIKVMDGNNDGTFLAVMTRRIKWLTHQ